MEKYIGTRIVKAKPITKAEYANGRLTMQEDELTGEEGYMVEYPSGRISWVYKDLFEETYRKASGMSFGLALEAMKKGHRISRWPTDAEYIYLSEKGTVVDAEKTPWCPISSEMLADDWFIVEKGE